MKKLFVMLALAGGTMGAFAQTETDSAAVVNKGIKPVKEVYSQKEEYGDLYHGLTRKLTFDRMIPPYGLEVTYDKTTHIIFPSSVRYVDLGSPNLIAGKADGAENVIRVKATVKNFREETNMSVITESGSFYTFSAPIIGA
jgi:conjugative transposon TraN protein